MSQPAVTIIELDGQLGNASAGASIFAMVGPSDAGSLVASAAYSRVSDVIAAYTAGPLVEYACHYIKVTGLPVLLTRSAASVAGTKDAIDVTGVLGTSVVTSSGTPNDDVDAYFIVVAGGTIGVAGITYQWSADGGRTLSPITALGTANTLTFAFGGSSTLGLAFAAGTLLAGAVVKLRGHAPSSNGADLTAALEVLRVSSQYWTMVEIVSPVDGTIAPTVSTEMALMPEKAWLAAFRMPTSAETEATYLTAFNTALSAFSDSHCVMMAAGNAQIVSGVSARTYLRSPLMSAGARLASVNSGHDIAAIDDGPLVGVQVRDANGNIVCHDESANPGLDDSRATVLRTFDGIAGVYVNNPNTFAAAGSDFQYAQHRRIMNKARRALRLYFIRRLSQAIRVNPATGFILEAQALQIEAGARAAMGDALLVIPDASAVNCTLSRIDNILSTKTLTVSATVTPLAYPKTITIDLAFRNPATQVLTS